MSKRLIKELIFHRGMNHFWEVNGLCCKRIVLDVMAVGVTVSVLCAVSST